MKNKDILLFGFLGLILGISLVMAIGSNQISDFLFQKDYTPDQIPNSEQEIVDNCKNLNLTESAFCIRDNVKLFYNYSLTDEIYSDFNSLKVNGGNCYHYANLYTELAKQLGFNSEIRHYDWKKNVFYGHRMAFMWDDEKYCKLDLLNVYCDDRIENE